MASSMLPQWHLEVDATDVYSVAFGRLVATRKSDGVRHDIAAGSAQPCSPLSNDPRPANFVVDRSMVYWLTVDRHAICQLALAPAALPQTLVALADGLIGTFTIGPTALYYSVRIQNRREVRVVPLSGAQWSTLATTRFTVEHLATDATYVYWIEPNGLHRATHVGGVTSLCGGSIAHRVSSVAVSRGAVYVSTDQEIAKLESGGTSWVTIVNEGAKQIAVDASAIYWASFHGTVSKVPLGGGPVVVIAQNVHPRAIAVDGASAYFIDEDSLDVMQITPK